MRRQGIIAGGNWIRDHVKLIDAWPPQDALATITEEFSANGGGPYNLLVDLAHLGAPFPLAGVGLVGDDVDGRAILADCCAHGIDTKQLQISARLRTSFTDVMTVRETGRRTFFHRRAANAGLTPQHFDFSGTRAKLFHLGYLLLLDSLDTREPGSGSAAVLARARAAGLLTSVDCVSENSERYDQVVLPVLPFVDILFLNDFEAEKLTGLPLRTSDGLNLPAFETAAHQLLRAGVRSVVVIHCPEAVYACHAREGGTWQPSLLVPPSAIAGACGAGDALAAGFLFGVHEDWPVADCLRLGVASAAACLGHVTASEGVGSRFDCEQLARQLGYRSLP